LKCKLFFDFNVKVPRIADGSGTTQVKPAQKLKKKFLILAGIPKIRS